MATKTLFAPEPETPIAQATIDLRSDTVTQPTPQMRAAMAAAPVGDDVYGEDPTINALEARAAELFGREAALFVPTGTMGNQIAIRLHTQRGQEVICEARGHLVDWEMAMVADFSGCQLRTAYAEDGVLTWAHIQPLLSPRLYYRQQTGLISLENTHNMAGGIVTPLSVFEEIWAAARIADLPVHLDGARIFHAATYLGISVQELTAGFDSVMFCLSKGLCAPVGSLLVGSLSFVDRARSLRKALGGGMRQAGCLAAAGLIAMEQMPARLHEDHANARLLAERLAPLPQVQLNLAHVQTNIVIFKLIDPAAGDGADATALVTRLKHRGILAGTTGPHSVRFVTHHDVDRAACEEAARIAAEVIAEE
ncbi:MAG TPA: GntG family PLP-dependent aldolase [Acidobacteriaceae bacterium]